jgi:hypothetical protein
MTETSTFICSLCLYCNNEYFSLFGDYLRNIDLQAKILKYLLIDVSMIDFDIFDHEALLIA